MLMPIMFKDGQPRPVYGLLAVLALTIAIYSNTFHVPFLFDDFTSIHDLAPLYLKDNQTLLQAMQLRFAGYLTLKANYLLHQYDVWGYHLVNLVIHLINVLLVYWLTYELGQRFLPKQPAWRYLPLLCAALFAVHPLHTQAVTYIVQRLASLAALFYFLTLASFLAAQRLKQWRYWLLFLLAMVCGTVSKQNYYTIVLVFALLWLLETPSWKKSLAFFGLALAGIAGWLYGLQQQWPLWLRLDQLTRETNDFSRVEYFYTQIGVLASYLYKFVWPSPLEVEIIAPIVTAFEPLRVGLVVHLLLFSAMIGCYSRYKLISFALGFYYLAHAVESSLIPIADVAFEHRTYLPNYGLILAQSVISLIMYVRFSRIQRTLCLLCGAVLLLMLAVMTYQRNGQWADPQGLLTHELALNPNKPRVHNMLGDHYQQSQQWQLAAEHYYQAYQLAYHTESHLKNQAHHQWEAFLLNHIAALRASGETQQAVARLEQRLTEFRGRNNNGLAFSHLGFLYLDQQQLAIAKMAFERSLQFTPRRAEAMAGLALVYHYQAQVDQAQHWLQRLAQVEGNSERVQELIETIGSH